MWTSSIAVAARTAAGAARLAGAEQDQHRPQPLAARREGRAGVLAERPVPAGDRLAQPVLDLAEPGRQPTLGGVEDRRHRRRHGRAGPSGSRELLAPLWIAMIPPARTV